MQKLNVKVTQVVCDYNQAEMNTTKLLLDLKCKLGECPLWRDNTLYFTDIDDCKWHKLDFTSK
jgi:sugar lactone lactonase YvrE